MDHGRKEPFVSQDDSHDFGGISPDSGNKDAPVLTPDMEVEAPQPAQPHQKTPGSDIAAKMGAKMKAAIARGRAQLGKNDVEIPSYEAAPEEQEQIAELPLDPSLSDEKWEQAQDAGPRIQPQEEINTDGQQPKPALSLEEFFKALNLGPVPHSLFLAVDNVTPDGSGVRFNLKSGGSFVYATILDEEKPAEFFGVSGPRETRQKIDAEKAQAVVTLAKSLNWEGIKVHGTDEEKGLLWLEAQKQGLQVTNYQPPEGSPLYADLAKFRPAPEEEIAGVSPSKFTEIQPSPEAPAAKAPQEEVFDFVQDPVPAADARESDAAPAPEPAPPPHIADFREWLREKISYAENDKLSNHFSSSDAQLRSGHLIQQDTRPSRQIEEMREEARGLKQILGNVDRGADYSAEQVEAFKAAHRKGYHTAAMTWLEQTGEALPSEKTVEKFSVRTSRPAGPVH